MKLTTKFKKYKYLVLQNQGDFIGCCKFWTITIWLLLRQQNPLNMDYALWFPAGRAHVNHLSRSEAGKKSERDNMISVVEALIQTAPTYVV